MKHEQDKNYALIELFREDMKFSAAHFTIFSDLKREMLHGHNFHVYVSIVSETNNGLTFDYTVCRKKILELCKSLNERCLMPEYSQYLSVIKHESSYEFIFNNKRIVLPVDDVLLMPLSNITTESLADWFLECICQNLEAFEIANAASINVKISTGPGQYAGVSKNLLRIYQ